MVHSYDEFMDQAASAAVAISGAHHSSWNHRTDVDVRENSSGATGTDGTIFYPDYVTDDLREMFAERRTTPEALRRYKNAVRVVLQRNAPLLSPEGRDSFPGNPWVANTTDQAFSDAWTLRKLDRYIDQLGLEEVVPGITSAELDGVDDHTARGTEAATLLASYIGSRNGLTTDEVLDRINTETPDRQLRVAAEMLGDPSLEEVLRREFAAQNTGSAAERTNVIAYHVGSPPPQRPRDPVPQDVVDAVRSAGIPEDARRAADMLHATSPIQTPHRLSPTDPVTRSSLEPRSTPERTLD